MLSGDRRRRFRISHSNHRQIDRSSFVDFCESLMRIIETHFPISSMMNTCEVLHLKILIIGEQMVGKSSLTKRFVDKTFQTSLQATIGADFKRRTLFIDGTQCEVQLWDTNGLRRSRLVNATYYRGASGFVLVYDVTNMETFTALADWLDDIKEFFRKRFRKFSLGTTMIVTQRIKLFQVKWADKMGSVFFETSAKDNKNVDEVFYSLTRAALKQRASVLSEPKFRLKSKDTKSSNKKCFH